MFSGRNSRKFFNFGEIGLNTPQSWALRCTKSLPWCCLWKHIPPKTLSVSRYKGQYSWQIPWCKKCKFAIPWTVFTHSTFLLRLEGFHVWRPQNFRITAGPQLLRLHGGVLRRPRRPRGDRGGHPRGLRLILGGRFLVVLEAGAEQPQVGRGRRQASGRKESWFLDPSLAQSGKILKFVDIVLVVQLIHSPTRTKISRTAFGKLPNLRVSSFTVPQWDLFYLDQYLSLVIYGLDLLESHICMAFNVSHD